jgi:hypothetical protein
MTPKNKFRVRSERSEVTESALQCLRALLIPSVRDCPFFKMLSRSLLTGQKNYADATGDGQVIEGYISSITVGEWLLRHERLYPSIEDLNCKSARGFQGGVTR